jgi:hypothetical protein
MEHAAAFGYQPADGIPIVGMCDNKAKYSIVVKDATEISKQRKQIYRLCDFHF